MDSDASSRIIHLHVPKTAGTALRGAFERAGQGKLRVFPHYDERKYAGIDPSQFDFFSGHFGFKTAAKIDGKVITVLRNPVDRFLSVYYFWRQLSQKGIEKTRNTFLASKYSLSEFVKIKDEPFLIEEFYNRMTWQIAHGSSLELRQELRDLGKSENEVFQLACTNLAGFSVVGVQERLGDFSNSIMERLGVSFSVEKANVTEVRAAVSDIDISTIHAIHEWTYMDIELYQQAYKLASN